ncbi:ATP-binding protein [Vibrio nereis]|uniref:histidine kinase n=1 Tax=Vibrio nereis TaxID=693 RepID=A0A0M0HPG0_VIBNE|nr:ATP-binding protein [Vibrio nereis]KOO03538.1 histidine kinase [Vibrio nereis]
MLSKKHHVLKRLSLRSRLVFASIVWLTAMIIAAGITVPTQVFNYMVDDTTEQLAIYLDELSASIEVNEKGQLSLPTQLADPRFNQPYSGLYWSIQTDTDLVRSRSLWDQRITFSGTENTPLGARLERLILIETTLYFPDYDGPISVRVGIDEQPIKQTVSKLMNQLWVILALLYFGILFIIVIQVLWSLNPLTQMRKELSQVRTGKKDSLDKDYPAEVSPMVSDLNALLFHYQELLERARNHSGNLSHALKTPLSVLKNEVNMLEEDTQHRFSLPLKQIQEQIDYHLGRTRMAGSKNILAVKTKPAERIDAISMAFDKVYADRGVTLINELDSEIEIAMDKSDFDEVVGNLLENAYKWSNNLIRVHSISNDNDVITILIEDDGPGIPEELLESAVQRGVRLDESTPGSGLGLNIACEIVHSYRGELSLSRSTMGGLKAAISLKKSLS